MDTLEDFANKNPGLEPADALRRYSDHTKLELLRSGQWDDQLVNDIDTELAAFGAENGLDPEALAKRPEQDDLRLTTQVMLDKDPTIADAARSYFVAQSDEARAKFADPALYEENLSLHRKSYEDLATPEVRNSVKREAMRSGDLPFAVIDGALEFSPVMRDVVGNDEALAKLFEAHPNLDRSLIPAVKQKLNVAPGYDVPGFDLDRQSDFYGALQGVMSKDPDISAKMQELVGAYETDKDTGMVHSTLDTGEPGVNDGPIAEAIASRLAINHGLEGDFSADEMARFVKDFAKTTASPMLQEGDVDSNVTKLSTGQAVLPMGVMLNKELFDRTMKESKAIPAEQKDALMKTRESRINAYAPDAFKLIADNRPEFTRFLTERKEKGATNASILDEWMSDPENHSSFRDYAGGIGESIVEGVGGLVLYPAALAGSESARGVIADLQKSDSDRRAYARMFGQNLGAGYDLSRLVAPVAADVGFSILTGGAGAAMVAGKSTVKTAIKNTLRTALTAETKTALGSFTKAAARRAGAEGVMAVDDVLTLAGKDIAGKLTQSVNTASYLGTAFNRSAGSTYVQLHTVLSDQKNADGSPKYSTEQVREIALNHGLIAGTLTAAVTGGFSMFGHAGMEGIYNGITRKQLGGIYDRMGANWKSLSPAVKAGVSMESPEKMLESIMRKSLGTIWGRGADAAISEGAEEGIDQILGYVNQQIATGEKIDINAAIREGAYASMLGGVMGGTVTGVNSMVRGRSVAPDMERMVLLDTAMKLDKAKSPQTAAVLRKFAQQVGAETPAVTTPEAGEGTISEPLNANENTGRKETKGTGQGGQTAPQDLLSVGGLGGQGEGMPDGSGGVLTERLSGTDTGSAEKGDANPQAGEAPGQLPVTRATKGMTQDEAMESIPQPNLVSAKLESMSLDERIAFRKTPEYQALVNQDVDAANSAEKEFYAGAVIENKSGRRLTLTGERNGLTNDFRAVTEDGKPFKVGPAEMQEYTYTGEYDLKFTNVPNPQNPTPAPQVQLPEVPARTETPASLEPVGSDPEAARTAEAEVQGEVTPLGLNRQPVVNTTLGSLSDEEFNSRKQEVRKRVDQMEKAWDEDTSRGDDPTFRQELADAQDDYSAVENEEFRRYMAEAEPEDIAYEFRQLNPTNASDKVKMAILLEATNRRGLQAQMKPFLAEYANRSSDHAEVLAGRMEDAAKVVQEMGGFRESTALPTPRPNETPTQDPAPASRENAAPTGTDSQPAALPAGDSDGTELPFPSADGADTPAAPVTPPSNPRDTTYEKLLTKGTPAGPNMVELTDKQVPPATRKKLLSDRDTERGLPGRPEETASFYLRPKADVTGVATDRGWILKDKRPDFIARNQPRLPESAGTPSVTPQTQPAAPADAQSPAPDGASKRRVTFTSTVPGAPPQGTVESVNEKTGKALIVGDDGKRYPNSTITGDVETAAAAPEKVGNTGAVPTPEEDARWEAVNAYTRPKLDAMGTEELEALGAKLGVKRQGMSPDAFREKLFANTHPDDMLDALAPDTEIPVADIFEKPAPPAPTLEERGIITEGLSESTKQQLSATAPGDNSHREALKGHDTSSPAALLASLAKTGPAKFRSVAKLLQNFDWNGVTLTLLDSNIPVTIEGRQTTMGGAWMRETGQIIIAPDSSKAGTIETVLHEMIHAATEKSLQSPTEAQQKVLKRIGSMRSKLLKLAGDDANLRYGLSNDSEFFSHMLTSESFRASVEALTPPKQTSFLKLFFDAIADLLLGKKKIPGVTGDLIADLTTFVKSGDSVLGVVRDAEPMTAEQSLESLPDNTPIEKLREVAPELTDTAMVGALKHSTFEDFKKWLSTVSSSLSKHADTIWKSARNAILAAIGLANIPSSNVTNSQLASLAEMSPRINVEAVSVTSTPASMTTLGGTEDFVSTSSPLRIEIQSDDTVASLSSSDFPVAGRVDIDQPNPVVENPKVAAKTELSVSEQTEDLIAQFEETQGTDAPRFGFILPSELAMWHIAQGDNPAVASAAALLGEKESSSTGIKNLLVKMGVKDNPSDFPWCTTFTSWGLTQAGIPVKSNSARSFLSKGKATKTPSYGDVVVMWNENPKTGGRNGYGGHTGFYLGESGGRILVLSGNSDDSVNVAAFSKDRVLGYRRFAAPDRTIASTARFSPTPEFAKSIAPAGTDLSALDLTGLEDMNPLAAEDALHALVNREIGHAAGLRMSVVPDTAIPWDAKGIGGTSNQEEISYFGHVRPMSYKSFRAIVPPGNWNADTIKYAAEKMRNGEPVAPPFLEVEWDDKAKVLKAYGHEGRSRSDAASQVAPGKDIPVHVFVRGVRARNLTEEMKNAPIVPENGGEPVTPQRSSPDIRFSPAPATDDGGYLAAVEAGDMETAQRMVDAAAKAAGYNIEAWHGTDTDFDIFDKGKAGGRFKADKAGFFFAINKSDAFKGGRLIKAFLKTSKPLVNSEFRKYGIPPREEGVDSMGYFDSNRKAFNAAVEKGGFDCVIISEEDAYNGGPINPRIGGMVVVFNPEQIKSADPVTRDEQGNVIPLSQRFNTTSPDIRFSPAPEARLRSTLDNVTTGNPSNSDRAHFITNPEQRPALVSYLKGAANAMWDRLKERFDLRTAVYVDRLVAEIARAEDGYRVRDVTMRMSVVPDTEYLAAVEAGDMETAQRMVDEAAKAAGYSSETFYHTATSGEPFTEFKYAALTGGEDRYKTNGHKAALTFTLEGLGAGWFTSNSSQFKGWRNSDASNVVRAKVNLKQPLVIQADPFVQQDFVNKKKELSDVRSKIKGVQDRNDYIPRDEFEELRQREKELAFEVDFSTFDEDQVLKLSEQLNETYTKKGIKDLERQIKKLSEKTGNKDQILKRRRELKYADPFYGLMSLSETAQQEYPDLIPGAAVRAALKEQGYDGIILEGTNADTALGDTTLATWVIPFDGGAAIKSAEPITYEKETETQDASGAVPRGKTVIPLSQRFNTTSPDIRFSPAPATDADGNLTFKHVNFVFANDNNKLFVSTDEDINENPGWWTRMFTRRDDMRKPLSAIKVSNEALYGVMKSKLDRLAPVYKQGVKEEGSEEAMMHLGQAIGSNKPMLTPEAETRVNEGLKERLEAAYALRDNEKTAAKAVKDAAIAEAKRVHDEAMLSEDPGERADAVKEYNQSLKDINAEFRRATEAAIEAGGITDLAVEEAEQRAETQRENSRKQRELSREQAKQDYDDEVQSTDAKVRTGARNKYEIVLKQLDKTHQKTLDKISEDLSKLKHSRSVDAEVIAGINAAYEWAMKAAKDEMIAHADELRRVSGKSMEWLEGNAPKLHAWATEMRDTIDEFQTLLSEHYRDSRPEMAWTIDNSRGVYLTRTWRIHQDPAFAEMALHDPEFADKQNALIELFAKDLTETELKKLQRDPDNANVNEADLRITAYNNIQDKAKAMFQDYVMGHEFQASANVGSTGLKTEFQRFMRKRNLDTAIEDVLGRIDDPKFNADRTLAAVSGILFNQKMLTAIKDEGIQSGTIITEEQKNADKVKYRDWKPLVSANVHSAAYAPLAGYYASPRDVDAMNAAFGFNRGGATDTADKAMASVDRVILGAAGMSLATMTLGSPGYFVRNVNGGMVGALAQGVIPLTKDYRKSMRLAWEYAYSREGGDIELREKLIALRIIGDGVQADYIKELRERYKKDPVGMLKWATAKGLKIPEAAKTGKMAWDKLVDVLERTAEFTETSHNAAVFFHDLDALVRSGLYETQEAAEQEAARINKMVMPSKSEKSQALDKFSGQSWSALVAPFARFRAEMFRTVVNTYRVGLEHARSDNEVLRKHGQQRLAAAFTMHMGVTVMIPLVLQSLLDFSDEEDKAIRAALPSYSQSSQLWMWDKGNGSIRMLDLTYANQFSFVFDILPQIWRSRKDPLEMPEVIAKYVAGEVIGENIVAGSLLDVSRNMDEQTGNTLWLKTDDFSTKVAKATAHVIGGSYTPAVLKKMSQAILAGQRPEKEGEDFFYTPLGILTGMVLPAKPYDRKIDDMAYRAFRSLGRENRELWQITAPLSSPAGLRDTPAEIYTERVRAAVKVWGKAHRLAKSYESMGMSKAKILSAMTEAGLSQKRASMAMRGFAERPVLDADKLRDIRKIDVRRYDQFIEAMRSQPRILDVR